MSDSSNAATAEKPKRSHAKKTDAEKEASAAARAAEKAKAEVKPKSTVKGEKDVTPVEAIEEEKPNPRVTEDQKALGEMLNVGAPSNIIKEETESLNVGLPPTMDYDDSVKDTVQGNALILSVYGEACLECSALIPSLADPDEKGTVPVCHFRHGNPHCPAGYHRIQIVGKRLKMLSSIKKAMSRNDTNRVLAGMAKLSELSLEDKKFVMDQLGLFRKDQDAAEVK